MLLAVLACVAAILSIGGVPLLVGLGVVVLGLTVLVRMLPRILRDRRYHALRLADIDRMSGHDFERYVARLLDHQGFSCTVTPGSGDLGVDVVARRGALSYAVQCKRYSSALNRESVSDAVAGKLHYNCGHAMVVTNQYFTPGAKQLGGSTGCVLVDRDELAKWITDFTHTQTVAVSRPPVTSSSVEDAIPLIMAPPEEQVTPVAAELNSGQSLS